MGKAQIGAKGAPVQTEARAPLPTLELPLLSTQVESNIVIA